MWEFIDEKDARCVLYSGHFSYIVKNDSGEHMNFLVFLSNYIMPFLIFYVIGYGLLKRQNIYEAFVNGARDGLTMVIQIVPTLIGLMIAVGVLRASGFLDMLAGVLDTPLKAIGFPAEVLPLSLVRMFSNSAAAGLLLDIFKEFGPDSYEGILASLLAGSTETIFYTMSVYFIAAKVKKIRYTLKGALLATAAGMMISILLAGMMIRWT